MRALGSATIDHAQTCRREGAAWSCLNIAPGRSQSNQSSLGIQFDSIADELIDFRECYCFRDTAPRNLLSDYAVLHVFIWLVTRLRDHSGLSKASMLLYVSEASKKTNVMLNNI